MSEVDLIAETHRWSEEYKKQAEMFTEFERNLIEQRDEWKARVEQAEAVSLGFSIQISKLREALLRIKDYKRDQIYPTPEIIAAAALAETKEAK